MEDWYENLPLDTRIVLSDSGYTNEDIGIQWLMHFIEHSMHSIPFSAPDTSKLLLLDNHGSHTSERFRQTAQEYNITPFAFPSHTTHLLQPLDVKVFQQYKHFHQKAIEKAVRVLDFEYKLRTFLLDLKEVRSQALTQRTICSGWREAGLWPYKPSIVIDKIPAYRNTTPDFYTIPDIGINSTPNTIANL